MVMPDWVTACVEIACLDACTVADSSSNTSSNDSSSNETIPSDSSTSNSSSNSSSNCSTINNNTNHIHSAICDTSHHSTSSIGINTKSIPSTNSNSSIKPSSSPTTASTTPAAKVRTNSSTDAELSTAITADDFAALLRCHLRAYARSVTTCSQPGTFLPSSAPLVDTTNTVVLISVGCVLALLLVAAVLVVGKKFHDGKLSVAMLAWYVRGGRGKSRGHGRRPRGYSVSREHTRTSAVARETRRRTELIEDGVVLEDMTMAVQPTGNGSVQSSVVMTSDTTTNNSTACLMGDSERVESIDPTGVRTSILSTSTVQTDVLHQDSATSMQQDSAISPQESLLTTLSSTVHDEDDTPVDIITHPVTMAAANHNPLSSVATTDDDYVDDESPYSTPFEVLNRAIEHFTESVAANSESTASPASGQSRGGDAEQSGTQAKRPTDLATDGSRNAVPDLVVTESEYSTPFEVLKASLGGGGAVDASARTGDPTSTDGLAATAAGGAEKNITGRVRSSSAVTAQELSSQKFARQGRFSRSMRSISATSQAKRVNPAVKPIPYSVYKKTHLKAASTTNVERTTSQSDSMLSTTGMSASSSMLATSPISSGYAPLSDFQTTAVVNGEHQQATQPDSEMENSARAASDERADRRANEGLAACSSDVYAVPRNRNQNKHDDDDTDGDNTPAGDGGEIQVSGAGIYARVIKKRRNTAPGAAMLRPLALTRQKHRPAGESSELHDMTAGKDDAAHSSEQNQC